jgi:hypothetical protein
LLINAALARAVFVENQIPAWLRRRTALTFRHEAALTAPQTFIIVHFQVYPSVADKSRFFQARPTGGALILSSLRLFQSIKTAFAASRKRTKNIFISGKTTAQQKKGLHGHKIDQLSGIS